MKREEKIHLVEFACDFMIKKNKKLIIYLIILPMLALFLAGCSNNVTEVSKEKVESEFKYLDTKLIALLNTVNGISLENYKVKAEKVSENSSGGGGSTGSDSSSSGGEGGQSGAEGGNGQSGGKSGSSGESGSSGSQSEEKNVRYKMEGNEILLQDKTPDWQTAKSEIEKIYNTWSTVILDLYKVNVNGQDILNFNADLDATIQCIKNEDKVASLTNLAKLYSYIPKYLSAISNDMREVNLYKTKSSILNAYAAIEDENMELVRTELVNAEEAFLPIINDINSNTNNQANINKAYILIKELQNSSNNKDKDIFYIKYKNLIQELTNIK